MLFINYNASLKAARSVIAFLVFLAIVIPFSVKSQRRVVLNMPNYDQSLFHFGFVLGVNQCFASIRPIDNLPAHVFTSEFIPENDILPKPDSVIVQSISSSPIPGFVIGILANMRMGDHFDLRFIPSLAFGDRTINYDIITYTPIPGGTLIDTLSIPKKIPSTYIIFPIEIRYKAVRYNNFRPYLMVGAQYSLDLASNAKKREEKNANEKIVKLNPSDFFLEGGVGFDFYNEWFKFGVELKMMYGFNDILKREHNFYTDSIERLSSKIFQLSLTFE